MNNKIVKAVLPHLAAIVLFLIVNFAYFAPQFQGQKVEQGDKISNIAMKGELLEFQEKTGKTYYWNNSMFSGMPWGMLTYGTEYNYTSIFEKISFLGLGRPANIFLKGMIFCYLVLVLLGVNPWLSIAGAIAFAFGANNFVLYEAGHNTKLSVIMTLPLLVGGFLLSFRKRYLLGGLLVALGTAIAIYDTHIQMVYYTFLALAVLGVAMLVDAIMKKEFLHFGKATGFLLVGLLLGVGANVAQLYSSQNFSKDTMRGEPILASANKTQAPKSSSEVEGLEWEYAMNWSNGWIDVFSLLIARAAGGSSAEEVSSSSQSAQLLRQSGIPQGSDGTFQGPMYWGPLPFTSGPYYVGTLILFFFVLSLFLLDGPLRWGFLASFIFLCLLSLGDNASWFNRPLFDYFPLFNKFRSPNSVMSIMSSILIIPGFMALNKVFEERDEETLMRPVLITGGILGAICLFFALLGGSFFSFTGPADMDGQGGFRYSQQVMDIFIADRKSLLSSDAFRALGMVFMATALLWAWLKGRLNNKWIIIAALGIVMVIDLWSVGKRYLDQDNFITAQEYESKFAARPIDQQIKQREPKGRAYYRVFDLSINTFNSSSTSYHHNTIGGYNAAKLQRYQDLIDYHISKGNQQVLNMLNTKYVISRERQLQVNDQALGNAWFASNIIEVGTPNEEIEALSQNFNAASDAVILKKDFQNVLDGFTPGDGSGSIELSSYEPNKLVYSVNTSQDQLAVFSEVWYGPDKGWKATIDGQPAEIIRANYLLRALKVPAGAQKIEFTFTPKILTGGVAITSISSILIVLATLAGIYFFGKDWVQQVMTAPEPAPTPKPAREKPVAKKATPSSRTRKTTPGKKKKKR